MNYTLLEIGESRSVYESYYNNSILTGFQSNASVGKKKKNNIKIRKSNEKGTNTQ